MYILDAITRSLKLQTVSTLTFTQPLQFVTSYVLIGPTTFQPRTQFGTFSYSNNTASILNAPSAGTQSQLKFFSLYNPNESLVYAAIAYYNDTTRSIIQQVRLNSLQTLFYTDGAGWYYNSSNDISSLINHDSLQGILGSGTYHLPETQWNYLGGQNQYVLTNSNVKFNTVKHPQFVSGYAAAGGLGYAITKSAQGLYTAQVDNLRVRGSLDVYSMVINEIRSTNGSLWISDAAKATSASYNSTTKQLVLFFQTSSLLPFISGDIIRSKRWGTSGSTLLSSWDCITTISAINPINATVTASAPDSNNSYVYTDSVIASWGWFANNIAVSGSDWVRMGNTSSLSDRQGAIYITSTDMHGPFIDVYDGVTSSAQVTASNGNIDNSTIKVRLGKLTGINSSEFGQLTDYGLYSDNAYLKGNIWSQAGNIGGWSITNNSLSSSNVILRSQNVDDTGPALAFGTQSLLINNNAFFGFYNGAYRLKLFYDSNNQLMWNGTNLQINAANFTLSTLGNISASNAILGGEVRADSGYFIGSVTANTGYIGGTSGWMIGTNIITSSGGIQISASSTPAIKIKTQQYGADGIWIGVSDKASMSLWSSNNYGLKWNGDDLYITSSKFKLQNGIMSAVGATFSGCVSASAGYFNGSIYANNSYLSGTISARLGDIAGWSISNTSLTKNANHAVVSIASSASYWNVVDNVGALNYNQLSPLLTSITNSYTGSSPYFGPDNWIKSGSKCDTFEMDNGYGVIKYQRPSVEFGLQPLAKFNGSVTIPSGQSYYTTINYYSSGSARPSSSTIYDDRIYLYIHDNQYNPTTSKVVSMQVFPPTLTGNQRSEHGIVYTNNDTTTKTIYYSLVAYTNKQGSEQQGLISFAFNNFKVEKFKPITQLSDKGLLIFQSPASYLKLTAETTDSGTQSTARMAVDEIVTRKLVVLQQSNISGTGGGGSGTIDGEGTAGKITIWADDNTIGDSIISQVSTTVSVAGTMSAPVYSGSGYYLDTYTTTNTQIGRLPSGANLTGKSIKEIMDLMINYFSPSFTTVGFGPNSSVYSSSTMYLESGIAISHPFSWSCNVSYVQNVLPNTVRFYSSTIEWSEQFYTLTGSTGTERITITSSQTGYGAYSRSAGSTAINFYVTCSQLAGSNPTPLTQSIYWNYYIKLGANSTDATLDSTKLLALTNVSTLSKFSRTSPTSFWSSSAITEANSYIWLCWPSYMGQYTLCQNPDSSYANYATTLQIVTASVNGVEVPYYCYRTGPYSPGVGRRFYVT